MVAIAVSIGVGITTIGVVLWKMSAGFQEVKTGLVALSASVNGRFKSVDARFDRYHSEHDSIFDQLRDHGEDIAILKDRGGEVGE